MPKLKGQRLKKIKIDNKPLWGGPEEEGITQSMIQNFLRCRERFRLKVIEGLGPVESFVKAIEYGNLWHACEEEIAFPQGEGVGWEKRLLQEAQKLCKKFPTQQEEIDKWYNVCKVQFPVYREFWKNSKDEKQKKNLLSEETFKVSYKLPSGRIVYLKGKFDSVDVEGTRKLVLQENKSKGSIEELELARQLKFDLQTLTYCTALNRYIEINELDQKLHKVRYNVVRRPLSGGKGTIRQHKPTKSNPRGESKEAYYKRLQGVIEENADTFFMRWDVIIRPEELEEFQDTCLNPILEQICQWYDWVSSPEGRKNPFRNNRHWRHPNGVYNAMNEGRSTAYDDYLLNGSRVGLEKIRTLFPELEE